MIQVYEMHGETMSDILYEMENQLQGKKIRDIKTLTTSYNAKYQRMEAIMIYEER